MEVRLRVKGITQGHHPTAGEVILFDRSWYNRANVEPVMGFCSKKQYKRFLKNIPNFENYLIKDGIILIKYWFEVSMEEQTNRFESDKADKRVQRDFGCGRIDLPLVNSTSSKDSREKWLKL